MKKIISILILLTSFIIISKSQTTVLYCNAVKKTITDSKGNFYESEKDTFVIVRNAILINEVHKVIWVMTQTEDFSYNIEQVIHNDNANRYILSKENELYTAIWNYSTDRFYMIRETGEEYEHIYILYIEETEYK